jgi:hypothetical protein
MDPTPYSDEGGKMQNLRDIQFDSLPTALDAVGELLVESGFETEEPEPGFSTTEQVEE